VPIPHSPQVLSPQKYAHRSRIDIYVIVSNVV
jgi:hypothetical protein